MIKELIGLSDIILEKIKTHTNPANIIAIAYKIKYFRLFPIYINILEIGPIGSAPLVMRININAVTIATTIDIRNSLESKIPSFAPAANTIDIIKIDETINFNIERFN